MVTREQLKKWFGARWRLASTLAAMVVIVLLPYLVTRGMQARMIEANNAVQQSQQVKWQIYQLVFLIRDSESLLYRMLAGNKVERVDQRLVALHQQVQLLGEQLREGTRDNQAQQLLLSRLDSMIGGRMGLMDQAYARFVKADTPGAYRSLNDSGTMFALNPLVQQIVHNEDAVLAGREISAGRLESSTKWVYTITAIAQVLLLIIIVTASERQIRHRRRAEMRVTEAVKRAGLILQTVREPIALLNDKLQPELVNEAFRELYGVTEIGPHALSIDSVGEGAWQDQSLLQRLRDVLVRNRELWDYELRQRTLDNTERFMLVNARRLQQGEEAQPMLLLTVSDITARTLVERQVNQLNRQLQGKVEQISDVNRELEAFSYSVSHDLRAPLRHISGFASKLEKHLGEQLDEKTQHYLDVITTSSRRMAQLIDDLLVFSRLGRGALRMRTVDMQSLVEETRDMFASTAAAEGRHIDWQISTLPVVIGDENMLRVVWQNLIGNAVKYTGQRARACISIDSKRNSDGDYEFTVSDNGAGFDMQYSGKLFGVFQRLHRSGEFPGNGIGLASVRRIITRHEGRIWAEAEPDKGARFHFTLPTHESDD